MKRLRKNIYIALNVYFMVSRCITLVFSIISAVLMACAEEVTDFRNLYNDISLTSSDITAIAQDKDGFLWVASRNELARFDGISFRPIAKSFNNELFSNGNIVQSMCITANSDILIGTDNGLFIYDILYNSFSEVPGIGKLHVFAIEPFKDDIYYLNTEAGLFAFSPEDSVSENIFPYGNAVEIGMLACIRNIPKDEKGNIYLSDSKQIIRVKSGNDGRIADADTLMTTELSYSIETDRIGHIYLYNRQGIKIIDTGDMTITDDEKMEVSALCIWNNTMMICKRGVGVEKSALGTVIFGQPIRFSEHYNDMSGTVNTFFEDRDGNLWAGTRNGIFLIEKEAWKPFLKIRSGISQENTLSHNTVSDIETDKSGNVWLATAGGLDMLTFDRSAPNRYSVRKISATHHGGNDWNKIEQICFDVNNEMWVGTKAGIRFYDPAADRFRNHPEIEKEFDGCSFVRAIYRDEEDGMWVGFNKGGLFRYDHKIGQVHRIKRLSNGYVIDNCTAICGSADGRIWVGTKDNGVILIEKTDSGYDGKVYSQGEASNIQAVRVSYIYTDSYNNVWCGTETGLYRYVESSDSFEKTELPASGTSTYICGIIEDDKSNLWISSTSELYRYPLDGDEPSVFRMGGDFARRGFAYGCAKDDNGYVFLSGIDGVTFFNPDEVVHDDADYDVVILDFRVNNSPLVAGSRELPKEINSVTSVTLPHEMNSISVTFSVLDYTSKKNIQYAYMLEGADEDWKYLPESRNIAYNNLKTGNYRLRMKSTNSAGVWQENERELYIIVRPSVFLSWYSILAYILAAGVMTAAAYIYIIRRTRHDDEVKIMREQIRHEIIASPKELQVMSADEKFLAKAMEVVERNISNEEFSVDIFAKEMCMSNSMLYRKIKALTDLSPSEFCRNARMKRAAQLLRAKAYTISEISMMVGFSDTRYFSTCFKKEFGQTPSAYQHSNSDKENNFSL